MKTKYKNLTPIKPNWSISNQFRLQLLKLTKQMTRDIYIRLRKLYQEKENTITKILDSRSPVIDILAEFKIIINKWQIIYRKRH